MTEDGLLAYEKVRQSFKQGRRTGKKPIDLMSLDECLDAEEKYLKWRDNNPTHEDLTVKKHIYENYLIPRIAELIKDLEFVNTVEKGLL